MRTTKINVYQFKELKPEIQEKVLNRFRENEEFYFLSDMLNEHLTYLLEKNKIKSLEEIKLYYNLGYSQSDYLVFEGLFKHKGFITRITERQQYPLIESNKENDKEITEKEEEKLIKIYNDLMYELKKYGYSLIDETLEDQNIKENIEINEYEFLENGDIFLK